MFTVGFYLPCASTAQGGKLSCVKSHFGNISRNLLFTHKVFFAMFKLMRTD